MTASKTFEFEHNGKKLSIPAFNALPMGAIRKARKAKDEGDQVFTIIEIMLGEDSPELAALDSMDAETFQAFMASWTQGAPLGESSSSAS